jgi:hypothetical protein
MIDCWDYNLIENVKSCFIENYWQTWDFWRLIAFLFLLGIIVHVWCQVDAVIKP